MSITAISKVLSQYLPPSTVDLCSHWIIYKNIHLKITRGRASKYGDYRPLGPGKGHRITVNHDLNPFAFLITFVHEVAHLNCYLQNGNRPEPHGKEWKSEFRNLLNEFLQKKIFPFEIEAALAEYIKNPAASGCTDYALTKALKKFDKQDSVPVLHLEELPTSATFKLHQSRSEMVFRKGERRRTRFQCIELKSKRTYFVGALAEVVVFNYEC